MTKRTLSRLPGGHRERVFIGGSYAPANRRLLADLADAVSRERFIPILADEYALPAPDRDIHDISMWLMHACRLAVFEASSLSGALMELERVSDYGIWRALLLYQHPQRLSWPRHPDAWRTTPMLKSLAMEQQDRLVVRAYARPAEAFGETGNFLRAIRRSSYGKLHGL